MKFSDGVDFTKEMQDEQARPTWRRDGWYCAGSNILIPCSSQEEAQQIADDINQRRALAKAEQEPQ